MILAAFCFWADQVVLGSPEDPAILLKYDTFDEGFFLCFHEQKSTKL